MMDDDEKVIADLIYTPVLPSEKSYISAYFKQRADEIFKPGWRIIDFGYEPALVCDIYVWFRIKGILKRAIRLPGAVLSADETSKLNGIH